MPNTVKTIAELGRIAHSQKLRSFTRLRIVRGSCAIAAQSKSGLSFLNPLPLPL
jgi:hypothetical protein